MSGADSIHYAVAKYLPGIWDSRCAPPLSTSHLIRHISLKEVFAGSIQTRKQAGPL
jgi:hypothetical protein